VSEHARRAIAWRHGYHAAVCNRVEPWAHGTVVRADDVPSYYEYNLARVEGADPLLEAGGAGGGRGAVARRPRPPPDRGRGHGSRRARGAGFGATGWIVERLAFLHRELPAAPPGGTHGAVLRAEPFPATRELRRAWRGESIWPEEEAFGLSEELVAGRRGTRAVIGRHDGEGSGFSAFSVHGDTAEVELVFCRPDRRNGGLGGALVARALEEAHAAARATR
jgi:hypothetical protein